MALDSTAREANVRDSLKKYFVDNLYTIEGYPVTFDKSLTTPKIQGTEVDKWVSVIFGEMALDTFSSFTVEVFCCTKKDSEGFKLAQLRDKVMGYLIDITQTDTMARIPFYRSSASEAWVLLGAMVVQVDNEAPVIEAEDGTKFKSIAIRLRWGTIC